MYSKLASIKLALLFLLFLSCDICATTNNDVHELTIDNQTGLILNVTPYPVQRYHGPSLISEGATKITMSPVAAGDPDWLDLSAFNVLHQPIGHCSFNTNNQDGFYLTGCSSLSGGGGKFLVAKVSPDQKSVTLTFVPEKINSKKIN